MVSWVEPQITEKSTLVTSEGAVIVLSGIVGINCYRKKSTAAATAAFGFALGCAGSLFVSLLLFAAETKSSIAMAVLIGGWSLIGIAAVVINLPHLAPIWRVEVLTTSGPVLAYESVEERPARMVAAKIHDSVFV